MEGVMTGKEHDKAKKATTYDALTIDTNVFVSHGKNLDHVNMQSLCSLWQYHVQLVVSEVVLREMIPHLKERIGDEIAKVKKLKECPSLPAHSMIKKRLL